MKPIVTALAALTLTFLTGLTAWGADPAPSPAMTASAVFAGGCFWCTEADFEKLPGVIDAISGYTGGEVVNPSYEQVSAGGTGHVEAVKVSYDPAKITYPQLLDWFWRHIDPTDAGGQFVDRGSQYRSAIFYANPGQQREAEASKAQLAASGHFSKKIVTAVEPLGAFYPAEDYHQNYYKENPVRYHYYRWGSGRDQFLEKSWGKAEVDKLPAGLNGMEMNTDPKSGKEMDEAGMTDKGMAQVVHKERTYTIPDDATLRRQLTPIQYQVTREDGTEPPFKNPYWDNHAPGIYVDIVSGEPLFSSTDKYDSGTGWPSYTRPLDPKNVVEVKHPGIFGTTVEVRSRHADSHLGHLFKDGPPPTGLRYCIDSAALRFIPAADLAKEGYEEYLPLFR